MIVICMGNELTGKTTFSESLATLEGWTREKCVRIEKANRRADAVDNFIKSHKPGQNLVFDRWYYPDDLIYEPLFFNAPSPLLVLQDVIERRLKPLNPLILFFTADLKTLKKRYQIRGDEFRTVQDLRDIEIAYRQLIKTISIPVIKIDTTGSTPEQTFQEGIKIIKAYGGNIV